MSYRIRSRKVPKKTKQSSKEQIHEFLKTTFLVNLFNGRCSDNNQRISLETAKIFHSEFKKRNSLEVLEAALSNLDFLYFDDILSLTCVLTDIWYWFLLNRAYFSSYKYVLVE